jgi:hypothetical protein
MPHNKELNQVRINLKNNLWEIINRKPVTPLNFKEYLIWLLVYNNKKVKSIPVAFLDRYADKLEKEYANILDFIEQEVNGNFSRKIHDFLTEYVEQN